MISYACRWSGGIKVYRAQKSTLEAATNLRRPTVAVSKDQILADFMNGFLV